ncbi:MAG: YegS/Rv2252/BmrU family lipid kinase [Bacilli bacterium]|nr:YegS/Rv2252/BmrU family lipid kinase [Bacilli bacterium]
MKKCIIIYNPNSGKKKIKKYLPEITKLLEKKEYKSEIYVTKYKKHAIKIVEELNDDIDLVMSIGGDGTFNEVMTGNLNRKKRLLLTHIPVGTTNDIGAMLGYGKNIIENVKLSLKGVVKDFDIGIINNQPFIYVAGIGKFTNLSYETPRELKKKIGHLAYIKEGIKTFFQKTKLYDISYEIDGEEYRGLFTLVLISNANHIAGIKNIYKDIKLDDNRFEIIFCNIKRKKDIFKSLYFLTLYGTSKVPGFYFYRTNKLKIKINNEEEDTWCIDGEKLEQSNNNKYEISIINQIKILVPKKNIKKLFNNN